MPEAGRKERRDIHVSTELERNLMPQKKRLVVSRSFISMIALVLMVTAAGVGVISTPQSAYAAPADSPTVYLDRFYCGFLDFHEVTINDKITNPCSHSEPRLGYIYTSQRPNTHALYACFQKPVRVQIGDLFYKVDKPFLSVDDPNCEGSDRDSNFRFAPIGYISTVDTGDSQPLYRCYRPDALYQGDHFYTHDQGCEGAGNFESLVGYTLNNG